MKATLRVAAWLLFAACGRWASAELANPFEGDETARRAGGALYAGRCADCHGADALGLRGPDLTKRFAAGASDETVFLTIRRGVAGSIMPPSVAPDNELWAIVTYLRGLSVAPPLASTGDAARGRARFARDCIECHRVGTEGGALGPDLTRIGLQRTRAALTAAIREPTASVPAGFRGVTVRPRGGERIEGVVKSEDAFSLQLLTRDGQLLGLRKRDVVDLEPHSQSPMPVFTPVELDAAALEDVLAYLGTLRGAPSGSTR